MSVKSKIKILILFSYLFYIGIVFFCVYSDWHFPAFSIPFVLIYGPVIVYAHWSYYKFENEKPRIRLSADGKYFEPNDH